MRGYSILMPRPSFNTFQPTQQSRWTPSHTTEGPHPLEVIYFGKQCYEQKLWRKKKYTHAGICSLGRSKRRWEDIILCLKHLWGYVLPQLGKSYERNVLYAQWDFWYEDFISHHVFKMRSSNFLMMTKWSTWLSDDDASSINCQRQNKWIFGRREMDDTGSGSGVNV